MKRILLLLVVLGVLASASSAVADPLQITTATNHTGYVSLSGYRIPTSTTNECITLSNSPAKTGPVNFYLDSQTTIYHTENVVPWDMLSGGTNDATGACRLGTLATGNHYVKATWAGGGNDQESFTVGPVPNTTVTSLVDADSPTFIDEDGNGTEQINVAFTGTNSVNRFECSLTGATVQAYQTCTSTWSPSVNIGTTQVLVRACDNAGCDATPVNMTVNMAAPPPPDTSITSVVDEDSPGTFVDEEGDGHEIINTTFTGSGAPVTYQCSVSGQTVIAYTSCTSVWRQVLNNGSNTISVKACNSGGCDATPASSTINILPQPVADTNITQVADEDSPTLVDEDGNGNEIVFVHFNGTNSPTSYTCSMSGATTIAPVSCPTSAWTVSVNVGVNTASVTACNAAGCDPTPATNTFTMQAGTDTTPPDTTITSSPSSPTNQTSASVGFTGTDNAGVTGFECQLDGGAYAACTSPQQFSTPADGSHTVNVRAKDAAGNVDPTPATASWTVDTSAPDTTITAQPPNPTTSASADFSFTSSESASFQCSLDGAAYAACTSPKSYTVAVGSHTFDVKATDGAGNTDATPAEYTWQVNAATGDPLVSTGHTATASSQEAARPPSLAFDQNLTTRWGSILDGAGGTGHDNEWIYVDLGQSYNVSRVLLNWESAYATSYKIQTSNNATTWTDVYSTTTGDGGIDDVNLTGTGRYVRMLGVARATTWGYSLWEFEVYGVPTPTTDPLVSTGDPATASSSEAARPPSLAFDQNTTTRWGSILDGAGGTGHDNEWIYVDLGQSYNVSRVRLNWESAYGTAYKIQVSDNASTWTDAYSTTTGDGAIDDLNLTATGRYVRMLGITRATQWGYSLWEMEVYGTPNGSPPAPQCSDGIDNADPEDTLIDYPADPGCTSATDDDETDAGGLTPPPAPGTWHTTFVDDFNSVDTNKWGFKFWWNGDSFWPTLEEQIYRQDHCTTSNGELSMTATKETPPLTNWNNNTRNSNGELFNYFSCWMSTGGTTTVPAKFLFTYGYAEARMKMGKGQGIWPGFWMQGRPSTNGTPFDDSHEIDIVEVIGKEPNNVHMTYHGPSGQSGSVYSTPQPVGDNYHVFAIDWEPGKLDWYVDGVLRKSLTRSDVPTTPRYVMLNHAVGGAASWPGAPDGSTVFPNTTKVDWVHVWEHN